MWFFKSPEFYFGEDALSKLEDLSGKRAFIVTDENLHKLGFVDLVRKPLKQAGFEVAVFDDVEPDPCLETVQRGAEAMLDFKPDWIIGLGGGSPMDAAQAMWILYEQPGIGLDMISPWTEIGLRQKARLLTIPTTAGTGAEASYGMIITDTAEKRKLTLACREATPDLVLVDPSLTANLPRQITADTGMDVLSHAVEAYSCTWANDFTDGLCMQAAQIVFEYLPQAVQNGSSDPVAREKMANAASIAGITLGNSSVALAHAFGHSAGAYFKQIPHGRITGLFLPYTVEYVGSGGAGRYLGLSRVLGLSATTETEAATLLATAIRGLQQQVGLPRSLEEAGVDPVMFEDMLPALIKNVEIDANLIQSRRIPDTAEVEQLFRYAFSGKPVDF